MNQKNHISHTIFDGGLNYNFYTAEQNNSEIIWSAQYVPIWVMIFDFAFTILGILSYIYVLSTGNTSVDILTIGIVLAIVSAVISSLTVMRLKKKQFAEEAYDIFKTYTDTQKEHLSKKGYYFNIVLANLYPIIILLCLRFIL